MQYKIYLKEEQLTEDLFKKIGFKISPPELIAWCKANDWVNEQGEILLYKTTSEEHYKEFKKSLDEVLHA